MSKNMLILHGGGPTAVINASLYGAYREAERDERVGKIYGAIGGTSGLLRECLMDLRTIDERQMELLPATPGSAIGTSRDALESGEYRRMAEVIGSYGIDWLLCNGGNGTMEMCGKLHEACEALGLSVNVIGIPKTMDNDLAVTDHCPGYGSAARYIAQSVREVCLDVKSMPIHVVVVEVSGRNAGWVAAASALAGDGGQQGPDLIYLPERPFLEREFLRDVSAMIEQKKGVVVVASEGLVGPDGKPVVPPVFKAGRSVYYGDVSAHLANLVIRKLHYKARGEKPGLLGRASVALQSPVDREEARLAGETACRAALAGESGKMVAFRRLSTEPYRVEPFLADIRDVMLTERKMPDVFINEHGNGVTEEFLDWCRPLIGPPLPEMASFRAAPIPPADQKRGERTIC
ncbi:MAG: diphosphate--fructose-6-phosphate 1-phosphotransferase [Clostridiales bacterium]|nr:diphosphate--fructose-6-phosphate 1-phosphotransferase [Clostridiales bacterium]